jgi:hypothetical protein
MQRGDSGHDRQTKAVAGQISAPVETVEAINDASSLCRRNAWAIVLDDQGDGVCFFGCPNVYRRRATGIFQGIIDQIHDCAREEILVAECHRPTVDFGYERDICGFRGGIVEFKDITGNGRERDRRKGLASGSGFGFGDLPQVNRASGSARRLAEWQTAPLRQGASCSCAGGAPLRADS